MEQRLSKMTRSLTIPWTTIPRCERLSTPRSAPDTEASTSPPPKEQGRDASTDTPPRGHAPDPEFIQDTEGDSIFPDMTLHVSPGRAMFRRGVTRPVTIKSRLNVSVGSRMVSSEGRAANLEINMGRPWLNKTIDYSFARKLEVY